MNLRVLTNFTFWIFFVGFVSVTWIDQVMHNWQQDDRILRNTSIVKELKQRSADRWTGADQENWIAEFSRLNPGLKFPEPKKRAIE